MDESALKTLIGTLQDARNSLDFWLYLSSILVVFGVLFEIATISHEYRDELHEWRRGIVRPPVRPSRRWLIADVGGVLVVCLGLFGEIFVGVKAGILDTQLRDANGKLIAFLNDKASAADVRSKMLEYSTQTLVTEAANAKLELARLTGPPYRVPVIQGIATPDISRGNKQVVLLTSDTRINLPTLPKDKSFTRTLFLTQDGVGQHQFTFFPQLSGFGNVLYSPPRSSWLVNLVTDSNGTVNVGLGGTFVAAPISTPHKNKHGTAPPFLRNLLCLICGDTYPYIETICRYGLVDKAAGDGGVGVDAAVAQEGPVLAGDFD
jgi:hypothetical protein